MTIRRAKQSDSPALTHLAMAVADVHHALDPYYKPGSAYVNFDREVASWLEDRETLLLVAEDNGRIVGYARVAVEEAPAYANADMIGVVYDVYVDPASRRKGIATQLMKEASAWFDEKQVKHVELSVASRNAEAIAFWQKLGFAPYKLRMRLDR